EPPLVTKKVILAACCAEEPALAPTARNPASARAENRIVEFISSSFCWLSAAQSAIDRDHRSGHVVGEIGGEKLDHPGTILHRSKAPQCHQFRPIPVAVAAAWKHRLHDPAGGNDPRSYAICRDAVGAEILRQIARVMGDRGLGGAIMRVAAIG